MIGSCHEDPYACNDATAKATVGAIYEMKGELFRYMRAEDAAWTNGDVLNPADATLTEATAAGASEIASGIITCGIACNTVTDAYYGYIMVNGVHTAVQTDAGVAAGDFLVSHNDSGKADTMAAGEEHLVFGYALAADSSAGYVAAVIQLA